MKIDVRNWIKGLEGVRNIHVADRRIAQELKASHMRSGRVSPRASEEAATAHVLAYGFDELGNIVRSALTATSVNSWRTQGALLACDLWGLWPP